MKEEQIKNYLDEYFKYIKAVFLNDYSKYLSEFNIDRIKNLTDVFKIDLENKFRIYCKEKINVNLNLKDFIEENNLNTDSDLKDISIEGRVYIKYLVDNQDNLNDILISETIRPMIAYMISPSSSVLTNGLIDYITLEISDKYKVPYKYPFESKEAKLIKELFSIVPKTELFKAILNNDFDNVRTIYNQNIDFYKSSFDNLVSDLNKEYEHYYKKLGRVYYTDSLYDYENLNYLPILKSVEGVKKNKQKQVESQENRFKTALESLSILNKHLIIYSSLEQTQIKNYIVEVEHLIFKIKEDPNHLDMYYEKLLELEQNAASLSEKLWIAQLTYPLNYQLGGQFCFLIGDVNKDNRKIIETRLFTEKHLFHLKKMGLKYGVIYNIKQDSILYASSKDVLGTFLYEDSGLSNVIKVDDSMIEIDNVSDSRLITPDMILKSNIMDNEMRGKVFLNKKNIFPSAIYCIIEDNKDYNYERAKELSDMYELPLILIDRNHYVKKENEVINKSKTKESFSERVRSLKDRFLYEEEQETRKKVI